MTDDDFKLIGNWPKCDYKVVGFIVQDKLKRVLCQLRDDFDHVEGHGRWTVFGGHHEPPESLLTCAVREMEEELGVKAKPEHFGRCFGERACPSLCLTGFMLLLMAIRASVCPPPYWEGECCSALAYVLIRSVVAKHALHFCARPATHSACVAWGRMP